MPSKNFTNFDLKTSISDTDYIVGYKEDGTAEYRTTFGDLVNYLKPYLEELPPFIRIDYLVVGGGGSGGIGGGGGAGGYVAVESRPINPGSYSVIVGLGGTHLNPNGQNSSFFNTTAYGGGGGGKTATNSLDGLSGGSGGGAFGISIGQPYNYGGSAVSLQGNKGGDCLSGNYSRSSSGGGASTSGANVIENGGSTAGNGKMWLNGVYYAGGGGAGNIDWGLSNDPGTSGGLGGGGRGGGSSYSEGTYNASSGSPNTGGGGGGTRNGQTISNAGNGGSGIVIIRYQGSQIATGGNITFSNGYTYHTFLSSSQFVI